MECDIDGKTETLDTENQEGSSHSGPEPMITDIIPLKHQSVSILTLAFSSEHHYVQVQSH